MRWWPSFLIAMAYAMAIKIPDKNFDAKQYFVVELDTSDSLLPLSDFIAKYNDTFSFEHPARGLDDHFVFSINKTHSHMDYLGNYNSNHDMKIRREEGWETEHDELVTFPGLRSIHMLFPKKLEKRLPVFLDSSLERNGNVRRLDIVDSSQKPAKEVSDKLGIEDPIFLEQWHLVNTQYPGNDVNVKNLWYDEIRGKGVTVAIIDDGLDYESPDLSDNFSKEGSWDFNNNNALPKPRLFDDYHGTRCAGEVAGVKNDVCGIGVAYEAKVAGIRILSGPITSEQEAAAMIYGLDHNDIYSCSWGPTDNGRTVAAPDSLVKKAIIKGIQEGRQNKGAIYVFASGNGGRVGDQCNFDGYTNSIYSITVGAIDFKGLHPKYAETCSAVMVVTYSSGSGEHIHTTDIHNKCSSVHGGTSAAAPLAAGIYALVLQANPELTWRDVQYVSAVAAVPIDEKGGDYQKTALGQLYSNKYGFGKIDAELLVKTAKSWSNVKPQAWHFSDIQTVNKKLSVEAGKSSQVISSTINISKEYLQAMNLERIEHVNVKINVGSHVRGKLEVSLKSPFGVVSELAGKRELDTTAGGLSNWVFMSVAHWGEEGVGNWTLSVTCHASNEINFKDWQLNFFGESIDADKAEKFDLDKDYVKVRQEKVKKLATSTSTTTSSSKSLSRKPTDTPQTETTTSVTSHSTGSSETSLPNGKPEEPGEHEGENDGEHKGSNKHYTTDHAGQYFMLLAVLGFIFVLAMMKWHRNHTSSRRRRRGDFEFDIIPGEDYTDSEEERESYELHTPTQQELERERLFDEFNMDSLPDYEDDAFQVGEEEEYDKGEDDDHATKSIEESEPASSKKTAENEGGEGVDNEH